MQLDRWVNAFNLLAILGVGISFTFGTLAIVYGIRLSKLKDLRIEEARTTAAIAKEETARLTIENTKLRTDLESATAESRARQSELAIEQQKLTKAQKQLADAERKRAETQLVLEKTLEEVRERQAPRTLSADQRTNLVELLKSATLKGEIDIVCVMGDSEGFAYATEFKAILKAGKWKVSDGSISQGVFSPNNPKGILLAVHDGNTAPKYAVVLQQVFERAGLALPGVEDPGLPEGKVELRIGIKP